MELDKIEALLEKYFEGETTLAEEEILHDYFSSTNVAPHLEQYQKLFAYFKSEKQQQSRSAIPQPNNRKKQIAWISIAASVAILLGVGMYAYNNINQKADSQFGTYDDPEVAFRETQKALAMLSSNVNVGIQSVHYVDNYENTKEQIFITE